MTVYTRGPVQDWVKDLTEGVLGGAPFAIGDTVPHPSGRTVKITGGQYWGTHGLSNFWDWREVLADGSLGPEESGYGWDPKQLQQPIASTSGTPAP